MFSGCEASDFEFDSGWDDNSADSSHVTVDTVQGIDVSMYDKARLFPGLVDTASEYRIADTVVYLDLSRKYIQLEFMEEGPQSIYSSGLYAGAGELVTIYVPDNVWGLTVQVGMSLLPIIGKRCILEKIPYVSRWEGIFGYCVIRM